MTSIVWVKFYRGITKTQRWCHYDVTSYFWDLKFSYFVKLFICYQAAKFQVPQLSESNFTEVSVRNPPKPLLRHHDVTSKYLVFKITHFVELIGAISLPNFIDLGCLDQILRGLVENTPPSPSDLHALPKISFVGPAKGSI